MINNKISPMVLSRINNLLICLIIFFTSGFSQNNSSNRIYEVWDNHPAPNRGSDFGFIQAEGYPSDNDWESYSYPIGNGFMGANVFGRTDIERIQITEKTLANEGLYGIGGLTNFAEIYLDINHDTPQNYKRSLNLNDAIINVSYDQDEVHFTREYLANYPKNIIAVKLSANKEKQISFTLRAENPYLRSPNEINSRTGNTVATSDLITLSGNIPHFSINYECQIKVINDGGELSAYNSNKSSGIRIKNANSAVLLIAAGTNYELSEKVFLQDTNNLKLDVNMFPHEKVSSRIKNAADIGFFKLKETHLKDYQNIFSRVSLALSPKVPQVPTHTLIDNYKADASNVYLEEIMFHFGRYLLISSSRKGTLPCGLQGVWSQYAVTPWTGGFWHNINVQMNYWGAFSTNMAETFIPYIEYHKAYLPYTKVLATEYIKKYNPQKLAKGNESNGWTIGTGTTPYVIGGPGVHSGPGTGGFTTKLFWDYYDFTRDTTFLRETGYPAIFGMGKFLSKTLKPYDDGLLLVSPSASPEQKQNGEYYMTSGTTFDQGFVWETYHDLLKSAEIINSDDEFLETVADEITRLDPIHIGTSGQVKEFRSEDEYGTIGDPHHRHVSHLCPLYPGTLINSKKPDWIQGVITALDFRGNNTTGWAMAHRMNLRVRTKEAEKARAVYSKFLKERTLPNLWTVHPPFQIDGNLGTMAGVAEMLLQSHEGYIEPLAALPKAWSNGEFSGLVARGNFEVDCKWEKGKVYALNITARSGAKCTIKYNNIAASKITDSEGSVLPFQIVGEDVIEFKTQKDSEYNFSIK
jgi:alpha-L-fucosidase 2